MTDEPSSGPRVTGPFRTRVRRAVLCSLALLALPWVGSRAQETAPEADSLPAWRPEAEVVEGVRRRLASRWGVAERALHLEWGLPRGGTLPQGFTGGELLGSGRGGHWVVSFHDPNRPGEARSVALRAGVLVRKAVAREGLERGQVLEESQMTERDRIHWGRPGESRQEARVGWVAQRRIRPGEVLARPALRPPDLVVSGRPVEIRWARNGVEVTMEGKAAGSGALGEEVFVRTGTGERLRGVVRGPGTVVIHEGTREERP
mgnify:CR=1 FL=1